MAKHERKSEFTYNHARRLYRAAQKTPEELFVTLKSSYKGLTQNEVQERLKIFGENHANDYKENSFNLLKKAIRNPKASALLKEITNRFGTKLLFCG